MLELSKVGDNVASDMIHIAIAKKVNEYLNMNENILFLGTIAPSLSELLKRRKSRSHFYKKSDTNIPDLDKFLKKYQKDLKRPFEMGYYIHLYVDKLWEEVFSKDLIDLERITLLNGIKVKVKEKDVKKILNKDFSNINEDIIKKYDIDLSLFDKSIRVPKIKIEEIPEKKVKLVIDNINKILSESQKARTVILDTKSIYKFIDTSSKEIIDNLKELGLIS